MKKECITTAERKPLIKSDGLPDNRCSFQKQVFCYIETQSFVLE
ncbi:MAG: hypothetical protein ACI4TK_11185 [Agathobacter sp.]